MGELMSGEMIDRIKGLLENARKKVAMEVNMTLLNTYWQIGKIIVEDEQQHSNRAEYGKQTIQTLSKVLTRDYGKGFSRSNLQNMRSIYLAYPKCQSLTGTLVGSGTETAD